MRLRRWGAYSAAPDTLGGLIKGLAALPQKPTLALRYGLDVRPVTVDLFRQ